MAVKQQLNPFDDPAVTVAVSSPGQATVYDRLAKKRNMTPSQRKKAQRDAARSKVTYDLPEPLVRQVEALARETYHCPASHLAALLIQTGLQEIAAGRLDVYRHRKIANSPRFDFFLDLDDVSDNGWAK